MPVYNAGEHRVDHPPLFACRDHKTLLRFTEAFVNEILASAEDLVPGNLAEYAAPYLGGNESAMRLPEYLIPPRVVVYNPDFLRGADALPFALIFINKRFVGIPARYLTRERFEGCPDCTVENGAPARAMTPAGGVKLPPKPQAQPVRSPPSGATRSPGSGMVQKPGAAPQGRPGSGQIVRKPPIPGIDDIPRKPRPR